MSSRAPRLWLTLLWLPLLVACATPSMPVDGAAPDAPAPDAGPPRIDAGPPADLDGFIEHQMRAGAIPGLAAAVIRGGEVVWVGTYGMADIDAARPVDEHTLFPVASISKTIVLVDALRLAEAGLLDLDAPADDIAPYAVRHPAFPDDSISTRMLLCHVSGVVDNFLELAAAQRPGDPTGTLEEFARGYLLEGGTYYDAGANFGERPGTGSSYCNACFGILGSILESAGDESFHDRTAREILEPLALDGAGWFLADVDPASLAVPYACARQRCTRQTIEGYEFYPASSLRISVTGLARFARMWIRGGELDGVRVLSEASVQEALRYQYPDVDGNQGLSLSTSRWGTHVYWGHSGATYGGSANFGFDPGEGRGLVLLSNSDAYVRARLGVTNGREALRSILDRLDAEAF